jgi:hypothetical protein
MRGDIRASKRALKFPGAEDIGMNVKWERWSAIAEIFSSIAILLTLFYLANQTAQISRQTEINTAALLANARQNALNSELQMLYVELDHPKIWTGPRLPSRPGISDDVLLGILIDNIAFFRTRENSWLQYQSGVLDAQIWDGYLKVLIESVNSNPLARESWDLVSVNMNSPFVAEIDKYLN